MLCSVPHSADNGTTWKNITENPTLVTPGNYLVRVKATDSAPHGAEIEVTVGNTALDSAKTAAKETLDNLFSGKKQGDYDAADWDALTKAVTDGKNAIDNAQTVDDVTAAKNSAVSAMEAVKTKAQKLDTAPNSDAGESGQQAETPASQEQAPAMMPAEVMERITIPKTPAKVKAKAKKSTVTVSWKKIRKNKKTKALRAMIKGIEVQYSTDLAFPKETTVTKTTGGKKTKYVIKGLQRKTVYFVRVRYTDGAGGYSNWSKVKRTRTK